MYCSHCGKKVEETMLFCPFCGEAITLPEQDDPTPEATTEPLPFAPISFDIDPEPAATDEGASAEPDAAEADVPPQDAAEELVNWNRERRSVGGLDAASVRSDDIGFLPLELPEGEEPDGNWREDIARRKQENAPERRAPQVHRTEGEPARLEGHAPRLEESTDRPSGAHRSANTYVPPKAMDPDDMFMDAEDRVDDYDDFDPYDDEQVDEDDAYIYEDVEEGSFFMRHIRGIVALTLLVVLVLMFALYFTSDKGQRVLAQSGLAWKPEVYASIAREHFYTEKNYASAASYYKQAFDRDSGNFSYAYNAAMAYLMDGVNRGDNKSKAAKLLTACTELEPNNVDPYLRLLKIYPTAAERPWNVTQLIQKGFEITGDERLRLNN